MDVEKSSGAVTVISEMSQTLLLPGLATEVVKKWKRIAQK